MSARPISIASIDIDPSKYSESNLLALRENFPDLADETLARYLIARNDDLRKAMEQLQKAQKIRLQIFPVLKSSCLTEMKTGKLFTHGFDKEAKERNLEETGKLLIWWTEYAIRRRMPADKSKFTVLIDRSNHTHENSDLELIRQTASSFQDLFPERMYRCVIYPADFLFYTLWNIAKWFLDPVTRNKVQPCLAFSGVEQFIDRKYIPSTMGGDSQFMLNVDEFEDPYSAEELVGIKSGGEEGVGAIFKETEPMTPTTESERVAKVEAEASFNNETV